MSKLKELLKASMCNVIAIREAATSAHADDITNPDEATAAVNAAIIDALELPVATRSAAQVELAKACAEACEVARWHLNPGAPVTNRNRAGANGTTLQDTSERLELAMRACGETGEISMSMMCRKGRGDRHVKAKHTPKQWHEAVAMLQAAAMSAAARIELENQVRLRQEAERANQSAEPQAHSRAA